MTNCGAVGDAVRLLRVGVFAVVSFAAAACLAAAAIRPADQRLAERLTLHSSDFAAGWKTGDPPRTRVHKTPCATAPNVEGAITGFSESAEFMPVRQHLDKRYATSETRVFSSSAAATRWYTWAGAEQSACVQRSTVALWRKKYGYKVYDLQYARESFPLECPSCPAHQLSAWQIGYTIELPGRERWFIDWVAVRTQRAVIGLYLFSAGHPFGPDGQRLVAKLLKRR